MSILSIVSGGSQPPSQSQPQNSPEPDSNTAPDTQDQTQSAQSTESPETTAQKPVEASSSDAAISKASAESQIAAKSEPSNIAAAEGVLTPTANDIADPAAEQAQARDFALQYQQTLVMQNLVSAIKPAAEILSATSTGDGSGTQQPQLKIAVPDTLPDQPQ